MAQLLFRNFQLLEPESVVVPVPLKIIPPLVLAASPGVPSVAPLPPPPVKVIVGALV